MAYVAFRTFMQKDPPLTDAIKAGQRPRAPLAQVTGAGSNR